MQQRAHWLVVTLIAGCSNQVSDDPGATAPSAQAGHAQGQAGAAAGAAGAHTAGSAGTPSGGHADGGQGPVGAAGSQPYGGSLPVAGSGGAGGGAAGGPSAGQAGAPGGAGGSDAQDFACCHPSDLPGCDGVPAEQQSPSQRAIELCVCEKEPLCCALKWAEVCAIEIAPQCGAQCKQIVNDAPCCTTSPTEPRCPAFAGIHPEDAAIEACVCEADPFCCDVRWDDACVAAVGALGCGGACDASCTETCGVPKTGLRLLDLAFSKGDFCISGPSLPAPLRVATSHETVQSSAHIALPPGTFTVAPLAKGAASCDGKPPPGAPSLGLTLAEGERAWAVFRGGSASALKVGTPPPAERWLRLVHALDAAGELDAGLVAPAACEGGGAIDIPLWQGLAPGLPARAGDTALGPVDDDGYLRLRGPFLWSNVDHVGFAPAGSLSPLAGACALAESRIPHRSATCFVIGEPGQFESLICCDDGGTSCWFDR